MSSRQFGACVHPREMPRFLLALLFVVPVSLAILLFTLLTNGLLVGIVLFVAFLVWFGFEISYALLIGNWILVSEHNYPRLNDLLNEVKETIGVKDRIDIVVFQRGEFNAYFQLLFARRAIFMNSELLAEGVTDDELRWLIGRFVGRIRAKRRMGPFRYLVSMVEQLLLFNFFIFPYERATAYTGDRVGLAAIKGDISAAVSAMNKLMVGRELGYSVNPAGVMRQYRRVKGSFFGFLGRLSSPLPHMLARYVDLVGHAEEAYPAAYRQFAAMNPSLEVAGGTRALVRATKKQGDAIPNLIGLGLLGGGTAIAAASTLSFVVLGPGFGRMGPMPSSLANLLPGTSGYSPADYSGDAYDPYATPAPAADTAVLDDTAYYEAAAAHTVDAYSAYLSNWPNGLHRTEAEAAIASLNPAAIIGAWTFRTQEFGCDGVAGCLITGNMDIQQGLDGALECRFDAAQVSSVARVDTEQVCTITQNADGLYIFTSQLVSASSPTYRPDSFELRREGDMLVGSLVSESSSDPMNIEFTRAQ